MKRRQRVTTTVPPSALGRLMLILMSLRIRGGTPPKPSGRYTAVPPSTPCQAHVLLGTLGRAALTLNRRPPIEWGGIRLPNHE